VDSILIDEARTPLIISGPAVVHVDSSYDKFKPWSSRTWSRHQERLCPGSVRGRRACSRSCTPPTAPTGESTRRSNRSSACCSTRSKWASPRSEALLKLLEDPENIRMMKRPRCRCTRPDQTRALRPERGTVLRHRREEPRRRPHRKGPLSESAGSGRLRAAGPDHRCSTRSTPDRSRTCASGWNEGQDPGRLRAKAQRSTPFPSCSRPIASTRRTSNTSSRTTRSSSSTKTPAAS
jgi:hypothetical protein